MALIGRYTSIQVGFMRSANV